MLLPKNLDHWNFITVKEKMVLSWSIAVIKCLARLVSTDRLYVGFLTKELQYVFPWLLVQSFKSYLLYIYVLYVHAVSLPSSKHNHIIRCVIQL